MARGPRMFMLVCACLLGALPDSGAQAADATGGVCSMTLSINFPSTIDADSPAFSFTFGGTSSDCVFALPDDTPEITDGEADGAASCVAIAGVGSANFEFATASGEALAALAGNVDVIVLAMVLPIDPTVVASGVFSTLPGRGPNLQGCLTAGTQSIELDGVLAFVDPEPSE